MEYISECCFAPPATELDMSSVKYGGPSGFCGRCLDNAIFIPAEDSVDDPMENPSEGFEMDYRREIHEYLVEKSGGELE
jgi:hypothetical protein